MTQDDGNLMQYFQFSLVYQIHYVLLFSWSQLSALHVILSCLIAYTVITGEIQGLSQE